MRLPAVFAFFVGLGALCQHCHASRLRSRNRQICQFSLFRNGRRHDLAASEKNIIFRSNDVLVVQDGSNRVMISKGDESKCHEQAEVACGELSAQLSSKEDDAKEACALHQACNPGTTPISGYIRSMIGGALVARSGELNRVAMIGLGAGTIPFFWSRIQPNSKVEAIDVSADVISAAPCFGVEQGPQLQLIQQDGRKYIESQKDASYDVVFMDAFDNEGTIPSCLKTVDFFKMIGKKLAPGGILAMNVWRRELDKVFASFVTAFPGRTQIGQSPGIGNLILLGKAEGGFEYDDVADPTLPEASEVASARSWAADAKFSLISADGKDESETLSLLRAKGHALPADPQKSHASILQDGGICPAYAKAL
eukprot:gnl/MRDRNA2_/MRDRNA2_89499_c0_seq1.p1 gnl/MRDRNA2_/MRDRNA2_89499_c0~~gnl/MRDRNA2_/MRDRNA2_89499_c0_seq1.p1  ORF type:complete len:367 (-),score=65.34 gnl/MRDRNA2_/MRDRNA2_89499_c0_seq1:36-1136(-)